MTTTRTLLSGRRARLGAAACAAILVLSAGPAAAQFVERSRSVEGPRGGGAERHVERGGGSLSVERSAAAAGERSWLRERSRTADPDSGTATGNVGVTGPAGNTASATRSISAEDDGTYAVEGSRTTRSGETRSWSGTLVPEGE